MCKKGNFLHSYLCNFLKSKYVAKVKIQMKKPLNIRSAALFQISYFSLLTSIHIVPMENGIQKQFVCPIPSSPKIWTVEEMNHPSLT